jgi:hypothetical protein
MGRDRGVNRRHFIATGLTAAAWPLTAAGYLLPPHQIVTYTNRRLSTIRGLEVALVGEAHTTKGAVNIGERWRFAGAMEVDVKGGDGREAHWRAGGPERGHVELLPPEPVRRVLGHLFGDGDLHRALMAIGADPSRQRLALAGERVAHVIGAGIREETHPQIWIDQDNFNVLRVLFEGPAGPQDVRLDAWAGPVTQGHFPHQVRIFAGARWIRRLETDAVQRASGR